MTRSFVRALATLGVGISALMACGGKPVAPLPHYPPPVLRASADPSRTFTVDTRESRLAISVLGSGFLAPHDHEFVPQAWAAYARFNPADLAATRVELEVLVASLHDEGKSLGESARREVDDTAKGDGLLDATKYPRVRFTATRLEVAAHPIDPKEPDSASGALVGELELHGKKLPLRSPVEVWWTSDRLTAVGSTTFKQSAFGIEPVSKFFGALAVKDEVTVDYRIVARRSEPAPDPAEGAEPVPDAADADAR